MRSAVSTRILEKRLEHIAIAVKAWAIDSKEQRVFNLQGVSDVVLVQEYSKVNCLQTVGYWIIVIYQYCI